MADITNASEVRTRRAQIAVELAKLQERDCEQRRHMLQIETEATALHRELAELDLLQTENGWNERGQ